MNYLNEVFKAAVWGESPPKKPQWNRWLHRNLSDNHCSECLILDNCWFLKEETPIWPQHPFCHCVLEQIPYNFVSSEAKSYCAYTKFDPYLFDPENSYKHGKQKMFISWGYNVEDSKWLISEIEKQALEKYISGDYKLGRLNLKGQRISVRIEIPRKSKEDKVSFITGWMVRPNGYIKLATPYGGK